MPEPNEYIDPLYRLLKIDEPYTSIMAHPALITERQRIAGIKSLGLVFHIFPAGAHSKWEHYLGMYHIAEQIQQGLNQSEKNGLKWLCLIGGFGHLPCTYATASAIFLAMHLSLEFKREFRNLIKPLGEICSSCDRKDRCNQQPLPQVLQEANVRVLRGLLSAYKIRQLPEDITIGHRDSLILGCICPEDKLYRLYKAISRYDYMQRDLYHTGVASFFISNEVVFKILADGLDALENSPHMRFLDQLHNYLVDTLYLHPSVACLESLFAKVLAEKLCNNEVSVLDLLRYNDEALINKLEELLGKDFISNLCRRIPIYTIQRDFSSERLKSANSVKLEADLLGLSSKELYELVTYPRDHAVILSTYYMGSSNDSENIYRVMLNVLSENKRLYPITLIAFNLQSYLPRRIQATAKLGSDVLSYAFGKKKLNYSFRTVAFTLLKLPNYLESGVLNKIIWELETALRQYTYADELPPRLMNLWRMLQHPSRKRRRKLTSEDIVKLWRIMIIGLIDLNPSNRGLKDLWYPVLSRIRDIALNNQEDKGSLIETLAYLTELTTRKRKRQVIWVFPSVQLNLNSKKREVDVISISLIDEKVEIALMECTESGSIKKATADYNKILELKDYLYSQGFNDLTVRTEVYGDARIQKDFVSISDLCSKH